MQRHMVLNMPRMQVPQLVYSLCAPLIPLPNKSYNYKPGSAGNLQMAIDKDNRNI